MFKFLNYTLTTIHLPHFSVRLGYKRRSNTPFYRMSNITNEHSLTHKAINNTVIVAALGYFVDIYDLILFNVVRKPSLETLGFKGDEILDKGILLLNWQMAGMMIGGIIWGILGDKKGRLSILFFTILLYSVANIANAYVHDINTYIALRFIAGLGLAGELGLGITLVSEVMTTKNRGYGTTIVGFVGVLGAVLAFIVADVFSWQSAYLVGGGLGLALLVLRLLVRESGMFNKIKQVETVRGHFLSLFTDSKRFLKYLYCIFLGLPVWYIIGLLVFFSTEFAQKVFHIQGTIVAGQAIMYHYIGASIGSLLWGVISQWLHSRKKSLMIAMSFMIVMAVAYFSSFGLSAFAFYVIIFLLGITQGYWTIFITVASEQFGTNMRATVTTTVPNFVRGSFIGVSA
ncbi:MAG TPA: MFS transporter, partial [Bacteroidia bacterium]|nr:MFS transporter [Bacteroidia bacterium]